MEHENITLNPATITERNHNSLSRQFGKDGEEMLFNPLNDLNDLTPYDKSNMIYSRDPRDQTSVTINTLCGRNLVSLFQIFTKKGLEEYSTPRSVVRGKIWESSKTKRDAVLKELGVDVYFLWFGPKEEYRVYLWKRDNPEDVIALNLNPTVSPNGQFINYTFTASMENEKDVDLVERLGNIISDKEKGIDYEVTGFSINAYSDSIDKEPLLGDLEISLK
jgi:hypothetical protein